jgi:uncharacterized membrane protein YqaE (UPF0057 family)
MPSEALWQPAPVHRPGVGTLIAALLLPPLAVFLTRGITPVFWVSVVATLIGWLPGVVFAFVTLFRPDLLGRLIR